MISRRTERHFQVIGTIDVEAFSVRRVPSDEAAFREVVGPAVCRAGGDAVIPGVTGDGRYVLAAVVKWVDEGTTAPVCVDREHPRGEGRPARDSADSSEPHGGSNVALCAGGPSC